MVSDKEKMSISHKIRAALAQTYILMRHPDAINLRRKGIRYEHFRDLNKRWILDFEINSVLDIGANNGQFARLAREVFPSARIYSFEPLPDCFAELKNALPGDKNFFPYEFAIGSCENTLEFYRSFHTPSSSFLKMKDLHKEAFPESHAGQNAEPIRVQVKTLDGVFCNRTLVKNILVKIDVQGFEMEAIQGAERILEEAKIVILEMSFLGIYANQPFFHDVYQRMYDLDFRFRGSLAQMLHPITEEVIQTDAIFVRE